MTEQIIWGLHAKHLDAADTLRKKKVVAIGWHQIGDLAQITPSREAFKARYVASYPETKEGAVPVHAGILFRFVHELKQGDIVIYPSKFDRLVNIGRISGPYRFDPSVDQAHPHCRPVEWLKSVPRTQFSQGALYEIGSALTLFQVKNFAEEFLAVLGGDAPSIEVDEDDTVSEIVEDIEETTQDFILKTLSQELKGHPFAYFVAHVLNAMGYRTRVSPEGPDGGIDIIAHRDELGFEPPIIKVQVKSSEEAISAPDVQALYGTVGATEFGLLVTLGRFKAPAKAFARSKSNLRLIDGEEFIQLVLAHYGEFEPRYKAVLPLKRVYIPGTLKSRS